MPTTTVVAQSISEDNLTQVKSDDLSDAELANWVSKYKSDGGDIAHLDEFLLNKGMAPEEVAKVVARVQNMTNEEVPDAQGSNSGTGTNVVAADKGEQDVTEKEAKALTINGIPIFGSGYFNSGAANFSPNVNRPIPQDYVLGPGDALSISLYGRSVANWNLAVKPEGFIMLPSGMGTVYVSGKTIENATAAIRAALNSNNLAIGNGTYMNVSLSNIRSIQVSINGEVRHPGTYTLSSLSTVFNALYSCGGTSQNGSLREIKVLRDGRLLTRVDIYEFLLLGDAHSNVYLQDGDVIQVPIYKTRVSIRGQVKRPAYYEMMPGESFKDLLFFAGGFKSEAYTDEVKVIQFTGTQKRMEDIDKSQFDQFVPQNGDQYLVDESSDRFENRISIAGSVYRPGDFELTAGMTLTDLIQKAGGLKEDAFPDRGYIVRLNQDNTTRMVSFDVKEQANGTGKKITMEREDAVTIPSIFDLKDAATVTIVGQVRNSGTFPYSDSMTLEDLILNAGGFTRITNFSKVVIGRRILDADPRDPKADHIKLIEFSIDSSLSLESGKHKLLPYDFVSIFALPGHGLLGGVTITGEVIYPGTWPIVNKGERLSDILNKMEGLTAYAYMPGATLIRDNKRVGVDLTDIMEHPGSKNDLIVRPGDIIDIPRLPQTVNVSGSVMDPMISVYNSKRFKYYVDQSGGFSKNALKRKSYVVYQNGTHRPTKHFLFFKSYPKITPGATLVVPPKPEKVDSGNKMSPEAWIGLSTSLASLAAIIFAILRNTK